jgi:predicted TIM-barrel fold metal-dependent hydrolase
VAAPHRIDVHHHVVPPRYAAMLRDKGVRDLPSWSVRSALRLMDAARVRAAVLSLAAPGVWFGDPVEAERSAREANEFTAGVVATNSVRFGFFATLTLPDVPTAIKVADHAYDELGADGVVLPAGGLTGPEAAPLLRHLHERRAVALVHPGEDGGPGVAQATAGLVLAGVTRRYPGIRFILAHAAGLVAHIADLILLAPLRDEPFWSPARLLADEDRRRARRLDGLRQLYFDLALCSTAATLTALLAVADPRRVLYGSDYPLAGASTIKFLTRRYEAHELDPSVRAGVDSGNARALFPRLSALRPAR